MPESFQSLKSYIPELVLNHLAQEAEPITEPSFDKLAAAVLYADITGFTALTERLESIPRHRSGAGAEELTQVINAYFGKLIDLVWEHGGDIVKFAGDGLLALWHPKSDSRDDDIEDGLEELVMRAVQCGQVIQKTLNNYRTRSQEPLSLRIGIGAGDVFTGHVGGVFKRWEFLVAGDPLIQMSSAEGLALPGEIVLSSQAHALISDKSICTPISQAKDGVGVVENTGYRLESLSEEIAVHKRQSDPLPASLESALRPYVPAAILSKMDAGQSAWLAELRHVTVLFINLPDLEHTSTEELSKAHEVMRALQNSIYRFEGSINKLSVDDKGITLIAALGLPPLAHENDPERGVQAAIESKRALNAMGMRSAIGVASGLTFCGVIGNDRRREYTMMGDTVNLAARLMQVAQGDILCTQATYQSTRPNVNFQRLTPIKVKGKSQPVRIYRPERTKRPRTAQQKTHGTTDKLIGREEERFALINELQNLQRGGNGGFVLIEGEAGIGKSRLIEELMRDAERFGIRSLFGYGDSIEHLNPYHAWQPIFHDLFDIDDLATADEKRSPNFSKYLPDADDLLLIPLLDSVLKINVPDNEITNQMEGQVRADNTRSLLTRILQRACDRKPTMIVIEDGHLMDSASWALLLAVIQQIQPVLIILATRPLPEPKPIEYQQLLSSPHLIQVDLDTLHQKHIIELVQNKLEVDQLPEAVAQLIQDKAEGNPFYSEELAYALRDTNLLNIEDGKAKLAPGVENLNTLPFPDTIQGVITSRIDRLEPPQQLTLKVASVIGRVFAFHLLQDVHPIQDDIPYLKDYLEVLENLDITPLERPEPDLAYIFKHIITLEVSYNLMSYAQRQRLHQEVAEWYERNHSDDIDTFAPILAYHWSNAEVADKSIDYFETAGEEALRSGAYQEAIRFFNRTIEWNGKLEADKKDKTKIDLFGGKELAGHQLRQARWERQLGQAYMGLGQLSQSHEHTLKALELLKHPEQTSTGGRIGGLVIQLFEQFIHRIFQSFRKTQTGKKREAILEITRAYHSLTEIYFFKNETLSLAHVVLQTLNMAERGGLSPELAKAYANMGLLLGVIPMHRLARSYLQKATKTAQSLNLENSLAYVNLLNALYTIGVGDWEQTQSSSEESIRIYQQLGNQRRMGEALSVLAQSYHFRAMYPQANEVHSRLLEVAKNSGDIQQKTWALDGKASKHIREGDAQGALDFLNRSQPLFEHSKDRAAEFIHYGLFAVTQLYLGDGEKAWSAARKAIQLSALSSPVYSTMEGYAGVVEVIITLRKIEQDGEPIFNTHSISPSPELTKHQLSQTADQVIKSFVGYAKQFPIGQPRVQIWVGLNDWLSGKQTHALKSWRKSLKKAEALNMPYEQALSHLMLSRHLQENEANRQGHLASASELFEKLGIPQL